MASLVSDLAAVLSLARKIRKRFNHGPEQYKESCKTLEELMSIVSMIKDSFAEHETNGNAGHNSDSEAAKKDKNEISQTGAENWEEQDGSQPKHMQKTAPHTLFDQAAYKEADPGIGQSPAHTQLIGSIANAVNTHIARCIDILEKFEQRAQCWEDAIQEPSAGENLAPGNPTRRVSVLSSNTPPYARSFSNTSTVSNGVGKLRSTYSTGTCSTSSFPNLSPFKSRDEQGCGRRESTATSGSNSTASRKKQSVLGWKFGGLFDRTQKSIVASVRFSPMKMQKHIRQIRGHIEALRIYNELASYQCQKRMDRQIDDILKSTTQAEVTQKDMLVMLGTIRVLIWHHPLISPWLLNPSLSYSDGLTADNPSEGKLLKQKFQRLSILPWDGSSADANVACNPAVSFDASQLDLDSESSTIVAEDSEDCSRDSVSIESEMHMLQIHRATERIEKGQNDVLHILQDLQDAHEASKDSCDVPCEKPEWQLLSEHVGITGVEGKLHSLPLVACHSIRAIMLMLAAILDSNSKYFANILHERMTARQIRSMYTMAQCDECKDIIPSSTLRDSDSPVLPEDHLELAFVFTPRPQALQCSKDLASTGTAHGRCVTAYAVTFLTASTVELSMLLTDHPTELPAPPNRRKVLATGELYDSFDSEEYFAPEKVNWDLRSDCSAASVTAVVMLAAQNSVCDLVLMVSNRRSWETSLNYFAMYSIHNSKETCSFDHGYDCNSKPSWEPGTIYLISEEVKRAKARHMAVFTNSAEFRCSGSRPRSSYPFVALPPRVHHASKPVHQERRTGLKKIMPVCADNTICDIAKEP
ncbi:hypothetical protein BJ508DRAFT_110955 [Ascobolus immersus RN42]|uniref:Uncharacterized protein n=1 Tax=Ascobolus immersus RN42 TaxID=1160509 RepID=A0A3N4IIS6_ASCIM|nr:hypothetical protein BJ508DRAFT_110955 [Ascobolus immersus RN42]